MIGELNFTSYPATNKDDVKKSLEDTFVLDVKGDDKPSSASYIELTPDMLEERLVTPSIGAPQSQDDRSFVTAETGVLTTGNIPQEELPTSEPFNDDDFVFAETHTFDSPVKPLQRKSPAQQREHTLDKSSEPFGLDSAFLEGQTQPVEQRVLTNDFERVVKDVPSPSERLVDNGFTRAQRDKKHYLDQLVHRNFETVYKPNYEVSAFRVGHHSTYFTGAFLGKGGMSEVVHIETKEGGKPRVAKMADLSRYFNDSQFRELVLGEAFILEYLQTLGIQGVPQLEASAVHMKVITERDRRDYRVPNYIHELPEKLLMITSYNGDLIENSLESGIDQSLLVDVLARELQTHPDFLSNPYIQGDHALSYLTLEIFGASWSTAMLDRLKERYVNLTDSQRDTLYEALSPEARSVIDRGRIEGKSFGELFRILGEVGFTLDNIHAVGICHNDLSANNITLDRTEMIPTVEPMEAGDVSIPQNRPHIIDFGVATQFVEYDQNVIYDEKAYAEDPSYDNVEAYLRYVQNMNKAFCGYSIVGKVGHFTATQLKSGQGLDAVSRQMPHPKRDVAILSKVGFELIGRHLGFDGRISVVLSDEYNPALVRETFSGRYDSSTHDFRLQMLMNFTYEDPETGEEKTFLPESFLATFLRTYNHDEHFSGLYPHQQLEIILDDAGTIMNDLEKVFRNAPTEVVEAFIKFMHTFNEKPVDGKEIYMQRMERLYKFHRKVESVSQEVRLAEEQKLSPEDYTDLQELRSKIEKVGTPDMMFNRRLG